MSERSVIRCLVGGALPLLGLAACGESRVAGPSGTLPDSVRARYIIVQPTTASVKAGDTIRFTGTVMDSSGLPMPGLKVKWSSTNESILAIDSAGLAYAPANTVGNPSAEVVAQYYTLQTTVTVAVRGTALVQKPPFFVWPDTNVLYVGMTRALVAEADNPNSFTLVSPAWRSSDSSIVSVSDSGRISAIRTGHIQISAVYNGQTVTAEVYVLEATPPLRFATVSGGTSPAFEGGGGPGGCGLLSDGSLYCWGFPFPEMDGPFDRCESRDKIGPTTYKFTRSRCSEIPRRVPTDLRFVSLGFLVGSGCAVATTGAVYCWGGNSFGELGIGAADGLTRGLTRIASSDQFRTVVSSFYTRCALRLDGAAICWGWNNRGDAGVDPSVRSVASPTRLSQTITFRSLSPGGNCGLAVDSTAYCWGSHVGDSTYAGCQTACSPAPRQMGATRYVTMASVGTYCGLTTSGSANCWGYHGSNPYDLASPVTMASDVPFVGLGPSQNSTIYALSGAGDLYEFTSTPASATPTGYGLRLVNSGGITFKSFSHSCGISMDGRAYCSGRLLAGQ